MGAAKGMTLLDTDVLIEAQRGSPNAAKWLDAVEDEVALPAAVAWERLVGSRDAAELRRAARFLSGYAVAEFTEEDSILTRDLIENHTLSSGLSLPDYMIGAQAISRSAVLYTFNLRHFRVIPNLDARAPYER